MPTRQAKSPSLRSCTAIPAAVVVAGLLAGLSAALSACGSTPDPIPGAAPFQEPAEITAVGDWDDVETAVRTGAAQSEMAIERTTSPSDSKYIFELRTITDEPATMEVERLPATGPEGERPIRLWAHVGRFGNRAWEERLIGRTAARLKDLYGVDVAPVRNR